MTLNSRAIQVQFYRSGDAKEAYSGAMAVPKSITKVNHWYRGARKIIPQIPDLKDVSWCMSKSLANAERVSFYMVHKSGDSCLIVIQRGR